MIKRDNKSLENRNLWIHRLCQTSSKAFEISRNICFKSFIKWVINITSNDKSQVMHESPVQKPDWLGEKRLLFLIYLYIAQ